MWPFKIVILREGQAFQSPGESVFGLASDGSQTQTDRTEVVNQLLFMDNDNSFPFAADCTTRMNVKITYGTARGQ